MIGKSFFLLAFYGTPFGTKALRPDAGGSVPRVGGSGARVGGSERGWTVLWAGTGPLKYPPDGKYHRTNISAYLVKSPLRDTYPVKGHSPISSTSQLLYKVRATMVSITHEYRVAYTSLFIFVSSSHINIQHWSAAGTGHNFAFQSNNK